MDIDRFWQLIEQARAKAGPDADVAVRDPDIPDDAGKDFWDFDDEDVKLLMTEASALDPDDDDLGDADDLDDDDLDGGELDLDEEDEFTDPVSAALYELLTTLPAAEIAGFDNTFEDVRARADRPELVNAAMLIEHGFLGDEGFDDFRAGLVALGRSAFESALASPDSLAEHRLVREIASSTGPRWLGREDMLFVASHAYSTVTGEPEVAFFDFAESLRADEPDGGDDAGEDPGDGWAITDEAETRRRLPRLSEMFYESSLRNRRRAMEKLGLSG